MRRLLPELLVVIALLLAIRYGFAQVWTKTSAAAGAVQSIALSADGKIIMSVGSNTPVVSTNWGATWTAVTPVTKVYRMAASADGTKLIGVSYLADHTYVSTDSANTWTATTSPVTNWDACAISADASKVFAAMNNGLIYASTNFGTNWTSIGAPSNAWTCLAVSADGRVLAAGGQNSRIYISTNSEAPQPATNSPIYSWSGIASSADGNRLLATSSSGTYVSTNGGINWRSVGITGISAASSADGTNLIVCNNSYVYTSTNGGNNWTTVTPSRYWFSVASSADGSELLAGENQGIYICQTTPSPKMTLLQTGTNVALSWLVPSTNFVLQQSPDLLSWSSITDTPALNPTNIHNELTLPATNDIGFYRLAVP